MAETVPLFELKRQYAGLREELLEAARRVLDSGAYVLGPENKAFETEFAAALGAAGVIGVSSGSQALTVALEALGVGPGDEVAVPAFTFVATAVAATELGARPVFVDVDPKTLTMDAADLERRLTPRVKAVLPVHLYGRPADMDALGAVARARGLRVVEDCAQSHLARWRGKAVGTYGDFGAFSFYPTKNLGALGDAGALSASDPALLASAASLRNCGRRAGTQYDHERVGHNYRLDELQAAFLRVKLKRLAAWTEARRRVAARYRELLVDLPLTLPPEDEPGTRHVYHLYIVRTPRRDGLKAALEAAGVRTGVYYPEPLHLTGAYRGLGAGPFPASEQAARENLALPVFPELSESEQERVAGVVRGFFR
ncbi:MAG: DegT/DnrJ/EryC1/StrS family aminotransferase [Elusimicrobia bacterium]|nr:DegT/DnrJ/EryC1/StrS family aminotransferase [Elusimicrobiota bacterium]